MLRKAHFTLIEIMMALAVLSIGMVAILGAFAVGFKANSDVISEGVADEAAKNIMAWIKYKKDMAIGISPQISIDKVGNVALYDLSQKPSENIDEWIIRVGAYKEAMTQNSRWSGWSVDADSVKALCMPFTGGNVLKMLSTSSYGTYHTYKIIRYRDIAPDLNDMGIYRSEPYYDPAKDNLEFEGNAVVWFESVSQGTLSVSSVVKVTIEVTWPVSLPYDQRKKYLYSEEF